MASLFKQPCTFVLGATSIDHLPQARLPEVAFIGRSNVGKSSLINALTHRKELARISKTPGRTQQLNFFLLAEVIHLVDLPGYGYARASKKEVAGWNQLMHDYLLGRPHLKRAFMLVDSRHGLKKNDHEMMQLLDNDAVSYQIILTKCDKQTQAGLAKLHEDIESIFPKHPALHPEILTSSSVKASGLGEVRATIEALV